ncbi:hypothetical protein ACJRPK_17300 [Aquimarina sp. 2-A2]|uniref:hypothetical protein n=1 Tax=Aquimarina sp. 2-A2 TaxID=3382644 RepID=UPI00387EFC93
MRNFHYVFIFYVTLSACSNSENQIRSELFSSEFKRLKLENKLEVVNLDSVSNYDELVKKMSQIFCEDKVAGLQFQLNKITYHVTGYSGCPTDEVVSCFFRRNLLTIRNDSLIFRERKSKPIEYLKTELKSIMSETYTYQYNENKLKPALFHLYVEDKYTIATTKKVLKEIIEQFDTISKANIPDFFKYDILFNDYDVSNIPPPPPPNEEIKNEI